MALYDRLAEHASKSIDYIKLMERNPTEIGVVEDVTFYEHPSYGDESPLLAVHHNARRACKSDCWDMDSVKDYL